MPRATCSELTALCCAVLCACWRCHVVIGSTGIIGGGGGKHEDRERTINRENKNTSTLVHVGTWVLHPWHELSRHTTCMKIRGSVVSLSFMLPHPLEDERKKEKTWYQVSGIILYVRRKAQRSTAQHGTAPHRTAPQGKARQGKAPHGTALCCLGLAELS